MRVLLAYSGGLDTSWLVPWLTRERGCEVTTLSVDCGGWTSIQRRGLERRALQLGAVEHLLVDARGELFDRVLRWLVAGNVRRGETYPLSVGAERGLQAEILARVAAERGFDAVAHGCTAAGNDQVRFEAALGIVAPGLEVLAPVRDLGPSREEQESWLREADLPLPPRGGRYSINAGLWGVTIGGAETHDSDGSLPEDAWHWTRGGSGSAKMAIGFEQGVPCSLDGEELDAVTLIDRLNREVGRLGIGRGYHLGDTVLGFKGRVAYEAPAATVLLDAHRELEKLVLTEDQRFWKDHMADVYGRRLHQGLFHDPFQRDVEALLASTQRRVTGTVRVCLDSGGIRIDGVASPFSLMAVTDARYGERSASDADPSMARGVARALSEPARLYARAAVDTGPRTGPDGGAPTGSDRETDAGTTTSAQDEGATTATKTGAESAAEVLG